VTTGGRKNQPGMYYTWSSHYAGRLAAIYGLAVLAVVGGSLLSMPFMTEGEFGNPWWYLPAILITALAPAPVIAATVLLNRDHGAIALLFALPALLGTLFCTGIFQLLTLAAAAHMSL
jgi:hypothetical protein